VTSLQDDKDDTTCKPNTIQAYKVYAKSAGLVYLTRLKLR